jgi:hypothetical protein
MDEIVAGLTTKSDKIRALDRAGYSRSRIAEYLGIRYQHVRNVLVDDQRKAATEAGAAPAPGMAEPARPFLHRENSNLGRAFTVDVAADGSLTLPPVLLAAVGLSKGGVLLARFDDAEIKLMTPETTTNKIREIMRRAVPEGVSLVDELLAERRAEAKKEMENE